MATYPRRPSYGIFVKFRRSRLALRRGIASLEDALALAEEIRQSRFHDRGDVFVVKEPEGIVVDGASATLPPPAKPGAALDGPAESLATTAPQAIPSPAPAERGPETLRTAVASPCPDGGCAPIPRASGAGPSSRPPPTPRPLPADSLFRLIAQVERMRSAFDRARAAQARFDSACVTAEDALSRWGHAAGAGSAPRSGAELPPGLRHNADRALALRASAARSIASFERVTVLVQRRVEAAWVEATRRPAPPRGVP